MHPTDLATRRVESFFSADSYTPQDKHQVFKDTRIFQRRSWIDRPPRPGILFINERATDIPRCRVDFSIGRYFPRGTCERNVISTRQERTKFARGSTRLRVRLARSRSTNVQLFRILDSFSLHEIPQRLSRDWTSQSLSHKARVGEGERA